MTEAAGIGSAMAIMLALVLVVAAGAKLLAPARTTEEFSLLNVPMPNVANKAVPALELAAATLLVIRPRMGAVAASALLIVFTAFLTIVIRSGRSVTCGCLGALSRRPVTRATITRNVVFLAMAGSATTVPGAPQIDLASTMTAVSMLLVVALFTQILALRNEIGRIWSVELAGERNESDPSRGDMKGITV